MNDPPYRSLRTSAGCPMRRLRNCTSLKFASTQSAFSGITVMSAWPGLDVLPQLHAALGHVAGDRCDHGVALRRDPGIAICGLGLQHGRILLHLGTVDQRVRCARLALRLRQRGLAKSTASRACRTSSRAMAPAAINGSRFVRSASARASSMLAGRDRANRIAGGRVLLAHLSHGLRPARWRCAPG